MVLFIKSMKDVIL